MRSGSKEGFKDAFLGRKGWDQSQEGVARMSNIRITCLMIQYRYISISALQYFLAAILLYSEMFIYLPCIVLVSTAPSRVLVYFFLPVKFFHIVVSLHFFGNPRKLETIQYCIL